LGGWNGGRMMNNCCLTKNWKIVCWLIDMEWVEISIIVVTHIKFNAFDDTLRTTKGEINFIH
jgi:hypothetical protein